MVPLLPRFHHKTAPSTWHGGWKEDHGVAGGAKGALTRSRAQIGEISLVNIPKLLLLWVFLSMFPVAVVTKYLSAVCIIALELRIFELA